MAGGVMEMDAEEDLLARAPVELRLAGGRLHGTADGVLGLVVLIARWLFLAFFIARFVKPAAFHGQLGVTGYAVLAALLVSLHELGRWGRRAMRRAKVIDARIVVAGDGFDLHHSGALAAPVRVPREAVRAVAVAGGRTLRVRNRRRALPFLGAGHGEVPNVAVVFERPVDFPWLPPLGRTSCRAAWPERGLRLRVRDPRAAGRAFGGWDVVRE